MTTDDVTEDDRRRLVAAINAAPGTREALGEAHGEVWNTAQLKDDFEVLRFAAPFVFVKRRTDGLPGTLTFQHDPRYYYGFEPHKG